MTRIPITFINPSMRLALRRFFSTSSSTTHRLCCHRYFQCRFYLFQLVLIVATAVSIATISLVTVTADDASTVTFPTTNEITKHHQQYRQRQLHEQTRNTVPSVTAFNFQPNCTATSTKKRKGRRYSGKIDSSSFYWREIVDEKTNTYTNLNYKDNNYITNENGKNKIKIQRLKQRRRRLLQLYFGKIKLSSMYDANYNDDDDEDGRKEIEEHPLRSDLWEMDVTWSFLSPKSNKLMMAQCGYDGTQQKKRTQRRKKLELELHPEGYCRIIEVKKFPWKKKRNQQQTEIISQNENENENTSNKSKDDINKISSVFGIGRWNKRPWGVTIVVRPLLLSPLPPLVAAVASLDNNKVAKPKQKQNPKKSSTKIDENTEYIFHARDFHWNGFGSNPKLTRGTILLETQKNKKKNNKVCWWKSSTSSFSSILPIWPEELQRGDIDEVTNPGNGEGSSSDGFLRPMNIVKRLLSSMNSSISSNNSGGIRYRWFRPVVGTFSAKGII